MPINHQKTEQRAIAAGFTLIELLVVVVIIAVVASMTFGEINSDSYQLKSRAHTLKAHMTQAKLEAVKSDLRVRVQINSTDDGYQIDSIDDSDNVVKTITTVRYENKFTFTSSANTIFTPRGTANSNSITIVKKDSTEPEYKVLVNNIGRVRLEKTK